MDADGGLAKSSGNKAGAKYGTGYCDAQCPRDIKFINGEGNVIDWTPSTNDVNSGTGNLLRRDGHLGGELAYSTTGSTTTTTTSSSTSTTTTKASTSTTNTSTFSAATSTATDTAAHYAQCGGTSYTGPTTSVSPYTCTYGNAYYSQCL